MRGCQFTRLRGESRLRSKGYSAPSRQEEGIGVASYVIRKVILDRVHGKLGEVDGADTRIGLWPSEEHGPITQFHLCTLDAHRGPKEGSMSRRRSASISPRRIPPQAARMMATRRFSGISAASACTSATVGTSRSTARSAPAFGTRQGDLMRSSSCTAELKMARSSRYAAGAAPGLSERRRACHVLISDGDTSAIRRCPKVGMR